MSFAAKHPDRTTSLVLYGSGPRKANAPDYDLQYDRATNKHAIYHMVEHWGLPAHIQLELLAPSHVNDRAFCRWWAELQRLGCRPGRFLESATWALDIDVRDILPTINVPTLIIHRTGDLFLPGRQRPVSSGAHSRSTARRARRERPRPVGR